MRRSGRRKGSLEMAAVTSADRCAMDSHNEGQKDAKEDPLKKLYPAVNEAKTPLPRAWSPKEKYNLIGLSQNNLRVHYKGHGKTHRDAASVQANHPIPAACGLYYFEVKIVSKGRDGYMGIGLSAHGVNMNRLPGWDKQSYGYHGDDGHSFCSSGTGQPYGPTFTTGDVIGCGVNLIDNTCFYTKNGHYLGTAFTDLPPNLYPTVGLQTPGEVVDANFGQQPFAFDIEDMMRELRLRTRTAIYDYPVPESQREEELLAKIVSTYLIHHGYYNTAEAFSKIVGEPISEDLTSMKNRQNILKLVLAGRMGEAIDKTSRLYPGLLERDDNLTFMLKCRQFVEMINGSDVEVCRKKCFSPRPNSPIQTSVIQSTKGYSNKTKSVEELNQNNTVATMNGTATNNDCGDITTPTTTTTTTTTTTPVIRAPPDDSDVEMESQDNQIDHNNSCNGSSKNNGASNGYQNGNSHTINNCDEDGCEGADDEMDVDVPLCRTLCENATMERVVELGKELMKMTKELKLEPSFNENNEKMFAEACSLLAYSNPWSSSVGWQLDPIQRESVCASLNSAILESNNKPRKPPLEVAMAHAQELVRLMATTGLGSCAFASINDLLEH